MNQVLREEQFNQVLSPGRHQNVTHPGVIIRQTANSGAEGECAIERIKALDLQTPKMGVGPHSKTIARTATSYFC